MNLKQFIQFLQQLKGNEQHIAMPFHFKSDVDQLQTLENESRIAVFLLLRIKNIRSVDIYIQGKALILEEGVIALMRNLANTHVRSVRFVLNESFTALNEKNIEAAKNLILQDEPSWDISIWKPNCMLAELVVKKLNACFPGGEVELPFRPTFKAGSDALTQATYAKKVKAELYRIKPKQINLLCSSFYAADADSLEYFFAGLAKAHCFRVKLVFPQGTSLMLKKPFIAYIEQLKQDENCRWHVDGLDISKPNYRFFMVKKKKLKQKSVQYRALVSSGIFTPSPLSQITSFEVNETPTVAPDLSLIFS